MKKIASSFLLFLIGFCFVIAAVVSLATVVTGIVSVNVNMAFDLGKEIVKFSAREQILLTLLYAAELAIGTLLIKWGWKL